MSVTAMTIASGNCLASLEIADRFGVNLHGLVAQAICFLIVASVLHRFVFKPVLTMVDARRRQTEEAEANAERIKAELKATEAARGEILAKAHQEAERIISEIKADAAELEEREKRRLEDIQGQMLAQAREDVLLAQAKLKTELKGEIADMIVTLTAKLAKDNLLDDEKKKIQQSAIGELSTAWRASASARKA
jgi:F-type H+-transporting ATPase subunit b